MIRTDFQGHALDSASLLTVFIFRILYFRTNGKLLHGVIYGAKGSVAFYLNIGDFRSLVIRIHKGICKAGYVSDVVNCPEVESSKSILKFVGIPVRVVFILSGYCC